MLNWWVEQSVKGRHIYPGNALYRTTNTSSNWPITEIIDQVNITRSMHDRLALGNIYFSWTDIRENVKGIQTVLAELYPQKAIVPKMNWLQTSFF